MTDLTKDWKDGKLSAGWYYIKIADIVFIDFFEGKVWKNKKDKYIDEVLAPVPSYDEWQAKDKENQQLKELLSKCLDELAEFNNSHYPETQELFSQIINATGEK